MNKVAIIIDVYQDNSYLIETIEGALNQRVRQEWQIDTIIGVVGEAKSVFRYIVSRFKLKDTFGDPNVFRGEHIYCVWLPDDERSQVRNLLAEFALRRLESQWLMFLNVGQVLVTDSLESYINKLCSFVSHMPTVIVDANFALMHENKQLIVPSSIEQDASSWSRLFQRNFYAINSCLIAGWAFHEAGGFATDLDFGPFNDWHLFCRLVFQGSFTSSDHIGFVYHNHKMAVDLRELAWTFEKTFKDLSLLMSKNSRRNKDILYEWQHGVRAHYAVEIVALSTTMTKNPEKSRFALHLLIKAVMLDYRFLSKRKLWQIGFMALINYSENLVARLLRRFNHALRGFVKKRE